MIDRHQPHRPCLRGASAVALVLLGSLGGGVGGCTTPELEGAPARPRGIGTAAPPVLSPGAVQVGRDLYQVPIGVDADGCQTYRLYSPTLLVSQAISYRRRDGGFTIDKHEAVCDRGAATGRAPGPGGTRALLQHGEAPPGRPPDPALTA